MGLELTHYCKCDMCGENLGDYKPYFAEEHLQKYPKHFSFSILCKKTKS